MAKSSRFCGDVASALISAASAGNCEGALATGCFYYEVRGSPYDGSP
nr:hypothetical protein CDS [Bradyrhizobium sp.]